MNILHSKGRSYPWARRVVVVGGRKKASAWRGAVKQQQASAAATTVAVDILLGRDFVCLVAVAADTDADSDDVVCNTIPALILPLAKGPTLRRQVWEL